MRILFNPIIYFEINNELKTTKHFCNGIYYLIKRYGRIIYAFIQQIVFSNISNYITTPLIKMSTIVYENKITKTSQVPSMCIRSSIKNNDIDNNKADNNSRIPIMAEENEIRKP